jgi:hypothetical protein
MRRHLCVFLSLAAVAIATTGALLVGMPASTASARTAEPAKLREAVRQVLTKLCETKKGLRPELSYAEAVKATPGAAEVAGGFRLSLRNSSYALEGDWDGVISFFADLDEPEKVLGDFDLALLCGDYDKRKMERWLLGVVGPALGLALEPDDVQKHLYWDPEPKRRDIWISLGDGVIQFSTSVVTD